MLQEPNSTTAVVFTVYTVLATLTSHATFASRLCDRRNPGSGETHPSALCLLRTASKAPAPRAPQLPKNTVCSAEARAIWRLCKTAVSFLVQCPRTRSSDSVLTHSKTECSFQGASNALPTGERRKRHELKHSKLVRLGKRSNNFTKKKGGKWYEDRALTPST